jgi:hypothetical protein
MDEAVSWLRGNNGLKLDKHAEISARHTISGIPMPEGVPQKKRQPMLRMNWLRNNDPNSDDVDAETAHAFANLTRRCQVLRQNCTSSTLVLKDVIRTVQSVYAIFSAPSVHPHAQAATPCKVKKATDELANP